MQCDEDGFGRTQTAARGAGLSLGDGSGNGAVGGDDEGFHAEGVGAVRVFEDGASDTTFPNDGADAGEGDVEARGLRELGSEEAELDFTGAAGRGGEGDGEDGSGGRVRLQIEMKEAEPETAIVAGEGGADGARVGAAAFKGEGDGDGGEGEDLRGGAGDEVVEKDAEDEEERVEEFDRCVELDALFESEGWFGGDEVMRGNSLGELAQAAALLAEAGDEFFFRKTGESAECSDAPAGEGFSVFGGEREDGERQGGKGGGFVSCGDHRDADRHAAGEAEGGMQVGADDDGGLNAEGADGLQELFSEFFRRAEELFGSGNVENATEVGVGHFVGAAGRRQTFDSGGKLAGALEDGGAGAAFFGERAREKSDRGEDFELGAGGSGGEAESVSAGVQGADPLARRVALEDDDGTLAELGSQAQHGLRGKFASVEAGVEGGHLRPAFSEWSGRAAADQGARDCQRTV